MTIKANKITKKAGFTKEQQIYICNVVLNEINKNANIKEISRAIKEEFKNDFNAAFRDKNCKVVNLFIEGIKEQIQEDLETALYNGSIDSEEYMEERQQTQKEDLIINVINSKCKFTLYYDFKVFIEFLRRCGVSVTVAEKQAKIFEILSDKNGDIIELKDAYTNGNILISKEFITGKPEKETTKHEKSMHYFISNNLIKVDNDYKIEKNQKSNHVNYKREKYQIFYKNKKDDFVIFNQKFINALPCGCDLYFDKNNFNCLIAKKEDKIVALIMPIEFCDGLQSFELLPDIVKENANIAHKNAVTGHVYTGSNAELLQYTAQKMKYTSCEWVGKYQARKLNKQIKQYASGAVIKVFYTDDDGRQFCKLETIYNLDELEEIKKVETSSDYKNMIERLKAV